MYIQYICFFFIILIFVDSKICMVLWCNLYLSLEGKRMKKIIKGVLLTSALTASSLTMAAQYVYFGAEINQTTYKQESALELDSTMVAFKAGKAFNPYFSIEAQAALAVSDGKDKGLKGGVDSRFSLLAVGSYAFNDRSHVYVAGGISAIKASVDDGINKVSDNGGSLSFLLGAEYKLQRNLGVNLSVGSYYSDSDNGVDTDVMGVGLGLHYYL